MPSVALTCAPPSSLVNSHLMSQLPPHVYKRCPGLLGNARLLKALLHTILSSRREFTFIIFGLGADVH